MTGAAKVDIGNFSRRTILTGAGWTRNWGGRLATELWEDSIGHTAVQGNPQLRALLLRESSFEVALGKTQTELFTATDRSAFKRALLDAFAAMDREISRVRRDPWINIYKVQDLVYRFWGQRGQQVDAGYMFTLNQDIWPERHLYNRMASGAGVESLPGLLRRPNQRLFEPDIGIYGEVLDMQPITNPAVCGRLRGCFNIVKLHGSFNWRTADQSYELVVGTGKGDRIATSPLLSWYWD